MRASAFRLSSCLLSLFLAGCISLHKEPPRPGVTQLGSAVVTLPAQLLGNSLIVEAKWDHFGPYHFLIDTGTSVVLVTPEFAQRYPGNGRPAARFPAGAGALHPGGQHRPPAGDDAVPDRAGHGALRPRARAHLRLLAAERAKGREDRRRPRVSRSSGKRCSPSTIRTARSSCAGIRPRPPASSRRLPGSTIPLEDKETLASLNLPNKTPIISVRLGNRRPFIALIDSGSDDTLSLNPRGLAPRFAAGPTEGLTVGTLKGDEVEQIGRLAQTLYIGDYAVPRPGRWK